MNTWSEASTSASPASGARFDFARLPLLPPGEQDATRAAVDVTQRAGTPLPAATRAFFGARFGHDFSQVRVHTQGAAASAAKGVGARAYTLGRDIVFGEGMYRPETVGGQRLLAHELAHVVQQRGSGTALPALGRPEHASERQAERAAASMEHGGFQARYADVSSHVAWGGGTRAVELPPTLSSVGACLQRVQLTYDDGPDSAGNTRRVLDALNAAGARATFYVVGRKVAQGDNWRVVFDIAASGHWLGNHAYDWDDTRDDHLFLFGTSEQRAQKMLQTEWAIRDALIQGKQDARQRNTWDAIPQANRAYIDDLIAHGTGRFRTPGFLSHLWTQNGTATRAAIASANQALAAAGLRPFAITIVSSWGISREGVTVDPEDYKRGRTQAEVESGVTGRVSSNSDSILLHSRIGATAAATPAILSDIKRRGFTFDATAQGALGSVMPTAGFAGLSTISNPPTSAEIATARAFLRGMIPSKGGFLAGSVAVRIFQMAQRAGASEVDAFIAEVRSTTVQTANGVVSLSTWMLAFPEWRLFAGFFENWHTGVRFPRIPGVTI